MVKLIVSLIVLFVVAIVICVVCGTGEGYEGSAYQAAAGSDEPITVETIAIGLIGLITMPILIYIEKTDTSKTSYSALLTIRFYIGKGK